MRVRIMRVSKAHQLRECKRYAPEGVKENVKAFHLRAYDIKANSAGKVYAYVKHFRETQKRRWETNTNIGNNEK